MDEMSRTPRTCGVHLDDVQVDLLARQDSNRSNLGQRLDDVHARRIRRSKIASTQNNHDSTNVDPLVLLYVALYLLSLQLYTILGLDLVFQLP